MGIFELTVCCQKVAKFQKKSCSSCIRASSAIFSLQEPTALKACCIELYLTWGHSSQSYGGEKSRLAMSWTKSGRKFVILKSSIKVLIHGTRNCSGTCWRIFQSSTS